VQDNFLIIFVKYPQLGFVKTRLAKSIGKKNATLLYKLFVEIIIKKTRDSRFKRGIFYTPYHREKEFIDWLDKDLNFYCQQGKDLGQRLFNAFDLVFQQGAKRAVVIGTDNPLIDKRVIYKALRELQKYQCVIGPSLDGGYYLLGLSCLYKGLFEGIEWGKENVLSQTLRFLKREEIPYTVLDTHFDIDDRDDLLLLKEKLKKIDKASSLEFTFLRKAVCRIIREKSINE
jgi:hypothetical protein